MDLKEMYKDTKLNGDGNDIHDDYHTMSELYFNRMVLFATICKAYPDKCWKSKLHNNGTMFKGYFIVGVTTPEGQFSYHYDLKYWDLFDVKVIGRAPIWDGHNPEDIGRLLSLGGNEQC